MINRDNRGEWKRSRKGFKHELILTLVELDFSFRKAKQIVETTFESIKQALCRKEEVNIEGFGQWRIDVTPREQLRGWRFGKIITVRPHKISFVVDEAALLDAIHIKWKAHPSWEAARKRKPKLRGRKLALFLEQEEDERLDRLSVVCIRTIIEFFQTELCLVDLKFFWTLRWNSGWFHNVAAAIPLPEVGSVDIRRAAEVIKATKPAELPQNWTDLTIDSVCWYARWSVRLKVDPEIWKEAEKSARDIMRRGY